MESMPNDDLIRLAFTYLPFPLAMVIVAVAYKMNKDAAKR